MRFLICLLALVTSAHAAAVNLGAGGGRADDGVRLGILSGGAPDDVFTVRKKLLGFGGKLVTHIVANRGHDNPEAGSFSFFESYSGPTPGGAVADGELFIGFFSERAGDVLQVQSAPQGLMIELIAWDRTKKLFNFWELVGDGTKAAWFYRGDSNDILADVERIDVGEAMPVFGRRLRCSGCHTQGGPIMKELAAPHNDWWRTGQGLPLGSMKLPAGSPAAELFRTAADAANLARLVREGTDRMMVERARAKPAGFTLTHELRSLVHTVEMNLASDVVPFAGAKQVSLPATFFVDERLAGPADPVVVDAKLFAAELARAGSKFAADEHPGLAETHHAFVVPTRSHVDQAALDSLVKQGLLDEELIADVLAVDFTTPVYSEARASLQRYFPTSATSAADLRTQLIANLRKAPATHAAALELLQNVTEASRDAAFHRRAARAYLEQARAAASQPAAVQDWLRVTSQRRLEIAEAQTSKNPRGTILEPGFRVIFPTDALEARPGALKLDAATARAVAAR